MNELEKFAKVQKECLEIFEKKNHDYGSSYKDYGTIGILIRMGDKINRCLSIDKKSVTMVSEENLRDTLLDLHNYCTMAVMLLDDKS